MFLGVNFYAYSIGNVTNIIITRDTDALILNQKLATLNEFAGKYNMPMETQL